MNSTASGGLVILERYIGDCWATPYNIECSPNTILTGSTVGATIGDRDTIQNGSCIRIASRDHMNGVLGTISGRTNSTTQDRFIDRGISLFSLGFRPVKTSIKRYFRF